MNKKAITQVGIALILGLIVIGIMGMIFAPKLAKNLQNWFTGVQNITQPHKGPIEGTISGQMETAILLPKDNAEAIKLLVKLALDCDKANIDKPTTGDYFCFAVDPKNMNEIITEDQFQLQLDKTGEEGNDLAGKTGLPNWIQLTGQGYLWEIEDITAYSKLFYICKTGAVITFDRDINRCT